MALKERLNDDLKAALLGGNRFAADTLRNLKAAILNEEVAQNRRDEGLNDTEIEGVIAREVKKRRESIVLYEQNERTDLAENEQAEIDVLSVYLPEQLSDDEIQTTIDEIVTTLGVTGPQAMGQVIGAVKSKLGSAADGATIARLVKSTLQQ
jgi:uncharacterized protein YqeY